MKLKSYTENVEEYLKKDNFPTELEYDFKYE